MAQTRVGLVLRTLGVAILLTWGPPQPDLAETMGQTRARSGSGADMMPCPASGWTSLVLAFSATLVALRYVVRAATDHRHVQPPHCPLIVLPSMLGNILRVSLGLPRRNLVTSPATVQPIRSIDPGKRATSLSGQRPRRTPARGSALAQGSRGDRIMHLRIYGSCRHGVAAASSREPRRSGYPLAFERAVGAPRRCNAGEERWSNRRGGASAFGAV